MIEGIQTYLRDHPDQAEFAHPVSVQLIEQADCIELYVDEQDRPDEACALVMHLTKTQAGELARALRHFL